MNHEQIQTFEIEIFQVVQHENGLYRHWDEETQTETWIPEVSKASRFPVGSWKEDYLEPGERFVKVQVTREIINVTLCLECPK